MQNQNLTELSMEEMEQVAGGSSTEWGIATGAAVGLLAAGVTVIGAPIVASALITGSIGASVMAMYYAHRGNMR